LAITRCFLEFLYCTDRSWTIRGWVTANTKYQISAKSKIRGWIRLS